MKPLLHALVCNRLQSRARFLRSARDIARLLFAVVPGGLVLVVLTSGCQSAHTIASTHYRPLASIGTQFAALPPAVQNAIRAQAGAAEIARIQAHRTASGPIYHIEFKDTVILPPLDIATNGSLLRSDGTVAMGAADTITGVLSGSVSNVKLSDLPPEVSKTLEQRVPAAAIASIHKELWGERPIYIFNFADAAQHPKMYILADGTILQNAPK